MSDFLDVLRGINGGKFVEELNDELHELVASTTATGKSGTLTISLKLKPAKGGGRLMTVEHDSSTKAPMFDRPTEYLFVTKTGQLVRDNPEQHKLELREVRTEAPAAIIA